MDYHTKKTIGFFIGAIGLISSVIGIYAFVSGHQTLEEALPKRDTGSQPVRVTTAPDQAASEAWPDPAQPLITGNAAFTLGWADANPVGYSFEQGAPAASGVPADISIHSCGSMEGATLCVIQASQVWELGQVPLPRVESVEGQEPGCEWRFSVSGGTCPVDLGQTYVVETFSGHLAKFRISNYQLKGFEPEFEIAIQWVYQPNERPDFASP